jgi:putative nucleotidyltransferase with HDIG domain
MRIGGYFMDRTEAMNLLKQYNQEPFHIQHAITVEAVMGYFAEKLGYGEDKEFWKTVGLLHDLDFEQYPEQHCVKEMEIMTELGLDPKLIHAVGSHGYGICCDVKPEHEMEKVLFATDELTGLIGAVIKMRPSKSTKDLELSSLKKKFKDKKFAAGCSRQVIRDGADMLGWELDTLMTETIAAMREAEDAVIAEVDAL